MITVSFDCENHNHALLLITLFDIITGREVDDSIAMMDNTGWLLDEIGRRLEEVDQFDVGRAGDHRLHELGAKVARLYHQDRE